MAARPRCGKRGGCDDKAFAMASGGSILDEAPCGISPGAPLFRAYKVLVRPEKEGRTMVVGLP